MAKKSSTKSRKLEAVKKPNLINVLNHLGRVNIRWSESLNRFVISVDGLNIGGNGCLAAIAGYGPTSEQAIEDLWRTLIHLPSDRYLVTYNINGRRLELVYVDGVGFLPRKP